MELCPLSKSLFGGAFSGPGEGIQAPSGEPVEAGTLGGVVGVYMTTLGFVEVVEGWLPGAGWAKASVRVHRVRAVQPRTGHMAQLVCHGDFGQWSWLIPTLPWPAGCNRSGRRWGSGCPALSAACERCRTPRCRR